MFQSALIVVLLDMLGTPVIPTITARIADTAIGTALALIVYFAWPTWEATSAREKFARLLEAQGEYATALLRQLAHPGRLDGGQLRGLQGAARRARSDAEASTERLSEEPSHAPLTPQLARALIATVRRLTQAELAIHALALEQHVHEVVPSERALLLDRLAAALATTIQRAGPLTRSAEAAAASSHLRQFQVELTSHATAADRALAGATDGLVDAVNTLDAILRDHLLPDTDGRSTPLAVR